MRKQTRVAIGVLMVVVGGLWCVQGLGWLDGSEMTGHRIWTLVGAAVVAGGLVVAWRAARGEDGVPSWATGPGVGAPERQPDPPAHPPVAGESHPGEQG